MTQHGTITAQQRGVSASCSHRMSSREPLLLQRLWAWSENSQQPRVAWFPGEALLRCCLIAATAGWSGTGPLSNACSNSSGEWHRTAIEARQVVKHAEVSQTCLLHRHHHHCSHVHVALQGILQGVIQHLCGHVGVHDVGGDVVCTLQHTCTHSHARQSAATPQV